MVPKFVCFGSLDPCGLILHSTALYVFKTELKAPALAYAPSVAVLYRLRTFGLWQAIGLLVTSALYYFCYHGVVDAARLGIPAGPYFDVLVVTLVAQFVSTFSTYGWYIYLLVRGWLEPLCKHAFCQPYRNCALRDVIHVDCELTVGEMPIVIVPWLPRQSILLCYKVKKVTALAMAVVFSLVLWLVGL